ncbi:MAG: family 16 glycoside hydrolase [Thermotogota bacterium]
MRRAALGLLCVLAVVVGGCSLSDSGILYEETWSDAATTEWYTGDSELNTVWIEDGRYHDLVKQATTMMNWNSDAGTFANAQFDVDVKHEAGTNNLSAGGLVFRFTDVENTYIFQVSASGYFRVGRWVADVWTTIVNWTASDAIHTGTDEENHLTVLADGTSLTFLINRTEVAEITDASFSTGYVGVTVQAFDENVDVEESFDNLVVRKL